ncbi:CLUMA_CG006230, isoform A [Clunio marinus]|uniref:AP complex subunit sigma n=1 Tax=Clunio marinus TaxID=568069 RepID=A0A1J1HXB7_9DIPT|nr:CLUMA_CG006230, isoform A [Clunio marinus]
MIHAVLVFNNYGKPRLSKFYQHFSEQQQQTIIQETFQLISKREDCTCNFLELPSSFLMNASSDCKLIYRHYATLYFVFCCDESESELGILDLIQVFVETLDRSFSNVCELDLIFNSDVIHFIVNEIVQSGMVVQTNMNEILARVEEQNKICKAESGNVSAASSKAVSAMKNINLPQLKDKVFDLPNTFKDLKF